MLSSETYCSSMLSLLRNRLKEKTSCESKTAFSPQLPKSLLEALAVLKSALNGTRRIPFSNNLIPAWATPSTCTAAQWDLAFPWSTLVFECCFWGCPHMAGHPWITVHDPLLLLRSSSALCGGTEDRQPGGEHTNFINN